MQSAATLKTVICMCSIGLGTYLHLLWVVLILCFVTLFLKFIIYWIIAGGNDSYKTEKISAFLDFGNVIRTVMPDAEFTTLQDCYDPALGLAVQNAYQEMTGKEVQTGSYHCLQALKVLAARTNFAHRENEKEAEQELKTTALCLVTKAHYGRYRAALMKAPL